MDKLREFGRKALFYVRVLSGYEERRIRNYRLQIEKHLQQAQARKAALRNIPEQIVLQEVRRMVEDMQALNKRLEETEAAIDQYFSPIDKEVQKIMKIQLEGEEKTMKQMAAIQTQAILDKIEAENKANTPQPDANQSNQDATTSSSSQPAQTR
ncbi:hypothetical protein like AT4G17010 [Hibiscus trionum]|uniref:Uncharacterized protein n=1 Tax=Hibiscus trionum TaxID=183268 RepID=A0A9W7J459_HIBTR|nr:hypothetical protein like AT4G17010 [Hibiscus trionum]